MNSANNNKINEDSAMTDVTEIPWQIVGTSKRLRNASPIQEHNKKSRSDSDAVNSTNHNQFSLLDNETEEIQPGPTADDQPKPPPIYIPGVSNISKMLESFCKVISANHLTYKSVKNEIRVMVNNVDSYRKLIKHLERLKINYHTYQLKQERAFRFVIKGIHHTTPVSSIKAELIILGHQVRNVMNVKSRVTKQPLPLFFVDIDPDTNNKDVYQIKHLLNAIVTIEPMRKTDDLVQCYRCQEFGHTKSFCKKAFRCVKCALDHPSTECPKDTNTPPRCIHCLQNHTANYKGCQVYQELVKKRNNRPLDRYQKTDYNIPLNQNAKSPRNFANVSYADALRGNQDSEKSMTTLMQMIIAKICN